MPNKIVKLHGCSGAGKTTVARTLMSAAQTVHEVIPEMMGGKPNKNQKPEAYVCEFGSGPPLTILGSYKNNCGGMDSYPSDAASIIKLIEAYRPDGHVFFEGLLLSTYYGGVGKHLEQYGDDFIMAFMNTPVIVCLQRVTERRDVRQSTNKFNPQLTIDKWNVIEKLRKKSIAAGHRVVDIDYLKDPVGQFNALLNNAS